MTDDEREDYRLARLAAVVCHAEGDENCRHAWNADHPDDVVSVEEQRAWWQLGE